jgi:hypothetical protein
VKVDIGAYEDAREIEIRIDEYDTWSMDHTLGLLILPMLKQLKQQKHGSPFVEIKDVPPELQLHGGSRHELAQYDMFASDEHDEMCWKAMHARWDWVMDEMIFAFECLVGELEDWEDQFWTGESDIQWIELENGDHEMVLGSNDTRQWDKDGYMAWLERMNNGFRLFGKYYRGLWD